MSGTPIGEMRVDLYADIARFVSQLGKASTILDRWGDQTLKTIEHVDKTLEKMGTKLTLKVTAPLVGLAAASLKAADPTGHVSNEIERLGLRAERALKPVGDVLVKLFDAAGPTMDKAVGYVHALSEKFDGLSDSQKKTTVETLAFAAATGPALIGLSIMTTLAKSAGQAIAFLKVATTAVIVPLSIAAVEFGAVAVGVLLFAEAGRQIYESWKPLQGWLADAIDMAKVGFAELSYAVTWDLEQIRVKWLETVNAIISNAKVWDALGSVAGMVGGDAMALAVRNGGKAIGPVPIDDQSAAMGRLHEARMAEIGAQNINTHLMIDSGMPGDFDGAQGNTTDERVWKNFTKMKDQLSALWSGGTHTFKDLSASADAFAAATGRSSESVVNTRRELELFDAKYKAFLKSQEEARSIQREVDPTAAFANAKLALDQTARLNSDIITPDIYAAKLKNLEAQARGFGETVDRVFGDKLGGVIANFASSTSDAFAQMAIDGKRSFGDLLASLERSLVSFLAKEALFAPLFNYLGVAIGGAFGSAVPATTYQGKGPHAAHGGVFPGPVIPFAAGGVVTSNRNFAIAGGTGLAGERGPEAIMPLTRTGNGLGVHATQSPVMVNIVDQRGSGARPEVTESRGPDGRRQISILIRDEVKAGLSDGSFDRHLSTGFGLNRRGTPR